MITLKAVARKATVPCSLPLNTIFWPPGHSLVQLSFASSSKASPFPQKIYVADIPLNINKLPHILVLTKNLQKVQTLKNRNFFRCRPPWRRKRSHILNLVLIHIIHTVQHTWETWRLERENYTHFLVKYKHIWNYEILHKLSRQLKFLIS